LAPTKFMMKTPVLIGFPRIFACVVLVLAAFGCQPARSESRSSVLAPEQSAQADSPTASGPVRDLSQDEAEGGHTLHKHMGRTDEELRERLRHEPRITAASTWADLETAERAVGIALQQNSNKIEHWLSRAGGHPNLVVDYNGDPTHPIGRSLRRGAAQPQPCSHAVIVLKWAGPSRYYVLTSYPECRA
jgi:hypothetical protein